jgi:hypothetical protein
MVRIMAVLDLYAFFDESGTDRNSNIVVVAGYIAPAADWNLLESQWLQALKERNAPYYHATDAEATVPRGPYTGWTVEQARELTDCMASIIASIDILRGVGVHVRTADWIAATDLIKPHLELRETKKFHSQLFNLPFQILAKSCIDVMLDCLRTDLPAHEKVAFIFEDNDFKHATLGARNILKREHPLRARIGSIGFEEKQDFAELQAADLFAWSYRRVTELRSGYKVGAIHRSLARISQSLTRN